MIIDWQSEAFSKNSTMLSDINLDAVRVLNILNIFTRNLTCSES